MQAQAITLDNYQLLRCSGEDALTFLQGQCSINIENLDEKGRYGAHCNAKGRMISQFYAARCEQDILLRLDKSLTATAFAALKKYIVFSKATLEQDETLSVIGLFSDDNETLIAKLDGINLVHHHQVSPQHSELWLATTQVEQLLAQLKTDRYEQNQWAQMLIEQGIAELDASQSEEFLPQEINLNLVGGVDFKKGCYTGQEVIARLHYRGALKKHLRYGTAQTPTKSGLNIQNSDKKRIGAIVKHCTNGSQAHFLALCNDDAFEQDDTYIESDNGLEKISWQALPYAIP